MISTATVGGQPVTLVTMPSTPGFRTVELAVQDTVAIVSSPFTGQTQAQQWPGADMWLGTMTLPYLTQSQADQWISFLMQCRGMANAFQLGDQAKASPFGAMHGVPVVDGTDVTKNGQATTNLYTKGWAASRFRLMVAGDYFQVGYRLHRVLDVVNSDANGKAVLNIWPSLREVPTDGEAIVTAAPKGLFRLATNKRGWSSSFTRLTSLSFQVMEYK